MKLKEYLALYEDAGPKIKQLQLARKELGLQTKLKLGAFNNDELVERCVLAFNSGEVADVIDALDGLIINYKGVRDASSFTYYLDRIRSKAPNTLFTNTQLGGWISNFASTATAGHEIKETAIAMKSMLELLREILKLTFSNDPSIAAFAKANLKALGITRGTQ